MNKTMMMKLWSWYTTHKSDASAHHTKYTDAKAVTAMGAKADDNPLHHDRPGDATNIHILKPYRQLEKNLVTNVNIAGIVTSNSWKVIGLGVYCASAQPDSGAGDGAMFGIDDCDLGALDNDYFGTIAMDTDAGKQWVMGDNCEYLVGGASRADACENGGTHVWAPLHFNEELTENAVLRITQNNAAGIGFLYGYFIIEFE